jgi:MoxR-like ATPase
MPTINVGDLVRVERHEDGEGNFYMVVLDIYGNDVAEDEPKLEDRHLEPVWTGEEPYLIYRRTEHQWRKLAGKDADQAWALAVGKVTREAARRDKVLGQTGFTPSTRDEDEDSEVTSDELDIPAEAESDVALALDAEELAEEPEELDEATRHAKLLELLRDAEFLKPEDLFLPAATWKLLIRNAVRGIPTLLVGEKGTGKSRIVAEIARVLGRAERFYEIPLNASQDARATLVGTMHFDKATGTIASPSVFLRALRQRNAFVNLDEVTRAGPDAQNILLQALNPFQGYVRFDEAKGAPKIEVARGVTFFGTSNMGSKYRSTADTDIALLDRFVRVDIPQLGATDEEKLLLLRYPNLNPMLARWISEIAVKTRENVESDNPVLSSGISTSQNIEVAGVLNDGFTLAEAAELMIYPAFNPAGGTESERAYVKQIVQQYLIDDPTPDVAGSSGTPW